NRWSRLLLLDQRRRRGLGGIGCLLLQHYDRTTLADAIADFDQDTADRACAGGGYLQASLVGLEREQRVVDIDLVARLDQHVDDGHVVEIADVWDGDFGSRGALCGHFRLLRL